MKLLVLCPRFPYPLEKGDKLRIYHQIKLLSDRHEICLICISSSEVDSMHRAIIEEITTECHVFTISKPRRNLSAFLALISGGSMQSAYYYSSTVQKQVNAIVSKFSPDHIYCQLTRMAPYVTKIKVPKTIDYMDAFGVGMERRAQVTSGLDSILYKLEARRMKKYESAIYQNFDHHTIISEQDRKCIGSGELEITINPNGIDTAYFSPIDKTTDQDIGFVGNMGYPPNVDAAEYLINTLKLDKSYNVLIAGARPDKRVKHLANKNVTVTGWVDDVRVEYARCRIFVAPLWSGTGQQNKILEAMAMGLPCITTTAVNNAINAKNKSEILIADNEKEFKLAIRTLLNDNELYQTIKTNGLKLVKSSYSWHRNVEVLESIFRNEYSTRKRSEY